MCEFCLVSCLKKYFEYSNDCFNNKVCFKSLLSEPVTSEDDDRIENE